MSADSITLVVELGILTFGDGFGIGHAHSQSQILSSKLCVGDQTRGDSHNSALG